MTAFKTWLEQIDQTDPMGDKPQALRPQRQQELEDVWKQTFQALGISGLEKATVMKNSFEDITHDRPQGSKSNVAVENKLKQIFGQLEDKFGLGEEVAAARSYLNSPSEGRQKEVGELLKAMFGQEQFQKLYDGEEMSSDNSSLGGMQDSTPPVDGAQVPEPMPTPPDQIGQPDPNDPSAVPGQQPQLPQAGVNPTPPLPTHPMTQKPQIPAGAFMGMY